MAMELISLDKHWANEIETEGSASLASSCSNYEKVQTFLDDAVDAHVALYRRTGASVPWIAYLGRVRDSRDFVGVCSFKDACRGGRVEIAYYTFPPYRQRGFGTAMASALVDLARRHPDVCEIIAHTQPLPNASTRILARLGFDNTGTVFDARDGAIWRWVLSRDERRRHRHETAVPMMRASALLTLLKRSEDTT